MATYPTPFPAYTGLEVRTLAEMKYLYGTNGQPYMPIELMDQANTILDDIMWAEANEKTGNVTTLRTKLPEVYWRRLYRGTPPSKSAQAQVRDPIGKLEGRALIDADLLTLFSENARQYRAGEVTAFFESMRQELATALIYGDIKDNPDGIHGLAPRYAVTNSPHVIDAGGTGNNLTSMWLVVWGPNDAHGIYANGSRAGLRHTPLPIQDTLDDNGLPFRAAQDLIEWWVGLTVRDWRSVVRIANIPVENLGIEPGQPGYVNLKGLMIQAKNMIPEGKRSRAVWYVNEDVMNALELQSTMPGNVYLRYGEYLRSERIAIAFGNPVRQVDAILNTEEQLPAA